MSNKYNLDFGSNNGFSIGVSNAGIAFRNMTIKALGYPERVNIGINKERGIIGVKVAREPDKFIKSYAFCNNKRRKSWLIIVSRHLVRAIEEITGITYGGKYVYYAADYDKEEKMLIVNLKKKGERKMKAILMSIQPKWCELIASGKKTVEVRKTAPKETPFKVYMYCTKGGYMYRCRFDENRLAIPELWNGKVIGEFICDKVDEYRFIYYEAEYDITHEQIEKMFLNQPELITYGKGRPLKGLNISELKIYDEPKALSEFRKPDKPFHTAEINENGNIVFCDGYKEGERLTRPPQSWQYVEELK